MPNALVFAALFQLRGMSAPTHPSNYFEMLGPRMGAPHSWGAGISGTGGNYPAHYKVSRCPVVGCYDYGTAGFAVSVRGSLPLSLGLAGHLSARDTNGSGFSKASRMMTFGPRVQVALRETTSHAVGLVFATALTPPYFTGAAAIPVEWRVTDRTQVAVTTTVRVCAASSCSRTVDPSLDLGISWQESWMRLVGMVSASLPFSAAQGPRSTAAQLAVTTTFGLQFGARDGSALWLGTGFALASDMSPGLHFTLGVLMRGGPASPSVPPSSKRAICIHSDDPEVPACVGSFPKPWKPDLSHVDVPVVPVDENTVRFESVYFANDSDVLDTDAFRAALSVARLMLVDRRVTLLEVGGHADEHGSDTYNDALTERRARAVAAVLVSQGVEPERLRVAGAGRRCPQTTGEHVHNRRVEFRVIHHTSASAQDSSICAAARK